MRGWEQAEPPGAGLQVSDWWTMELVPVRIRLDAGHGDVAVTWQDGHESVYPHKYLRDRCPCATCAGEEGPLPSAARANPLQMFTKAVQPERAELVGRYAVQFFWNDGHSAGIYTFEYLRQLCPCPACTALRQAAEGV